MINLYSQSRFPEDFQLRVLIKFALLCFFLLVLCTLFQCVLCVKWERNLFVCLFVCSFETDVLMHFVE